MGTLIIRNLENPLKSRLRLRAAARNHSMEEEARQILRAALQEPDPSPDFGALIRARFAGFADTKLRVETREPVRPPPALLDAGAVEAVQAPAAKQKAGPAHKRRR